MMANMISTPKNDIVSDFNEWLNRIPFKDETVLTDLHVFPDECT